MYLHWTVCFYLNVCKRLLDKRFRTFTNVCFQIWKSKPNVYKRLFSNLKIETKRLLTFILKVWNWNKNVYKRLSSVWKVAKKRLKTFISHQKVAWKCWEKTFINVCFEFQKTKKKKSGNTFFRLKKLKAFIFKIGKLKCTGFKTRFIV